MDIDLLIQPKRMAEHKWEDKYGVAHMAYAPLGQGHANEMFEERCCKSTRRKIQRKRNLQ